MNTTLQKGGRQEQKNPGWDRRLACQTGEMPVPPRWLVDALWLLLCGAASALWCITAAGQLGPTFDEPVYVAEGLKHWHSGSYQELLRLGTMPLPVDVQTWPLYLWERWHGVSFDTERDLELLLPYARAASLLFWWLLLLYGYLIGRQLAGPWGGRCAVAFLAFEPNLLAHASLATTDIAVTACLLGLVYHFRAGREAQGWRRWLWPTVWFAAAFLAKASGVVYGLLCCAVIELERLHSNGTLFPPHPPSPQPLSPRERGWGEGPAGWIARLGHAWRQLRPFLWDLVPIVGLGLVLTLLYGGSDWKPQPSFVKWAHGLPEGPERSLMVWLAENLRIFPNAAEGLVRQVKHNLHGHACYLIGHVGDRALWFYFPVLLTIKLTVAALLLPVVLLVLGRKHLLNWACLCSLLLFALSFNFRVQIGIRMILPLVALGLVGLAAALVQTAQAWGPRRGRPLLVGIAAVVVLWSLQASLLVWPHALCYVNELWGGTRHGFVHASEANYDWGQGLKELARWQRQHAITNLDVWYFGSDPARHTLPLRSLHLHDLKVYQPEQLLPLVRGRYLAVSTTFLCGCYAEKMTRLISFLHSCQPVDRTPTFLIYDFTSLNE